MAAASSSPSRPSLRPSGKRDLGLDRIGVLELVDEDRRNLSATRAGRPAGRGAGRAPQEQVLKVQPAVSAAPRPVRFARADEQRHHDGVEVLAPLRQRGFDNVVLAGLERPLIARGASPAPCRRGGPRTRRKPRRAWCRAERARRRARRTALSNPVQPSGPAASGTEAAACSRKASTRRRALRNPARRFRADHGLDVRVLARSRRTLWCRSSMRTPSADRRGMIGSSSTKSAGVPLPGGIPRDVVLRLVHLAEAGIDAGLDRALPQEARAESVDRSHEARLEATGGPPRGACAGRGAPRSRGASRARSGISARAQPPR